jgi:hypothetical protein
MLDITTLAAWGEFIGGIAVVVSLIYLASQIRSNTKTVRASNFNELLDATDQFSSVMRDSEWASLYVRAIDDFVGLSPEDQVRFNGIISPYFNAMFRRHLGEPEGYDPGLVPVAPRRKAVVGRQRALVVSGISRVLPGCSS